MKFIKHIFTGKLAILTIVFNFIVPKFFYGLIVTQEEYYDGWQLVAFIAISIYAMYWGYAYKTFKDKK